MSSSFRRAAARSDGKGALLVGLKGTKAWTGGITLTSVGLRDLDAILGGGQPLGTCLLLEEDRWTRDLALCLTKYWCAEAVSNEQTLVIPTSRDDDDSDLPGIPPSLTEETAQINLSFVGGCSPSEVRSVMDSLPRNLHWDKTSEGETQSSSSLSKPLEILEEEGDEEEEEGAEEGLQIAWQYRKSVQHGRLGHGPTLKKAMDTSSAADTSTGQYCHSYNLSGRLKKQRPVENFIHIVDGKCCSETYACRRSKACGFQLYIKWLRHVQQKLKDTNQVVRLLLYHQSVEATNVALPLLLTFIRTHQLPVVILVVTCSWKCDNQTALTLLRRTCDVVMQTEGFASRIHYPPPPEFRHLQGLLLLPKVSTVTAATANGGGGHFADMTVSKRPPANVYGLKRDRRKLHIPLLHIPPEDYAGGGGSVGGGAVRSGAGRPRDTSKATAAATKPASATTSSVGCGSTGGTASVLDF